MGSVSGRLGSVFVSLRPFGVVYGARALGAGPRWRPRPWPAAPGPRNNAAPGAAGRRSGRAVGRQRQREEFTERIWRRNLLSYFLTSTALLCSNERRGKPAQLPALLRNESAVLRWKRKKESKKPIRKKPPLNSWSMFSSASPLHGHLEPWQLSSAAWFCLAVVHGGASRGGRLRNKRLRGAHLSPPREE